MEMEIEVANNEASTVEGTQELEEGGPVTDDWSSAERLFLMMFALWFCYSCIFYLPDFLWWLKEILTSEVPEL
ncbi:hypothetical protein DL95DRAFT_379741 [Leptodontidium sp. 2 PMI_412]|nr:hypothetical protein DL95DRAFT_379741 [Leptodontidium sp. 2 PMI_412]